MPYYIVICAYIYLHIGEKSLHMVITTHIHIYIYISQQVTYFRKSVYISYSNISILNTTLTEHPTRVLCQCRIQYRNIWLGNQSDRSICQHIDVVDTAPKRCLPSLNSFITDQSNDPVCGSVPSLILQQHTDQIHFRWSGNTFNISEEIRQNLSGLPVLTHWILVTHWRTLVPVRNQAIT